ncbi:hypothetical protein Pmar_PMAR026374 [Perkinsus marinus ATCC 50983]|uniref:Uncharacterized protein n=1 Tax=Perkinsus marinus (strain ATCC 50983 / TXsc) TaxID=423536 RepID=C5LEK4_PERM5|nr:hypothetical protein Pmar_PMAR026374 [Perkinsus marinus ATCC 50983]EER04822.1 hypothetical protein Pmar_PMAR026374 [Perkinsus marinus ATCC 50983]|eukprot:XP_002773006.1 hypothetical protein Pmar_PMAR026374 [Perkinsus marinus ATCC 50983]
MPPGRRPPPGEIDPDKFVKPVGLGDDKRWVCTFCNYPYVDRNPTKLRTHLMKHHGPELPEPWRSKALARYPPTATRKRSPMVKRKRCTKLAGGPKKSDAICQKKRSSSRTQSAKKRGRAAQAPSAVSSNDLRSSFKNLFVPVLQSEKAAKSAFEKRIVSFFVACGIDCQVLSNNSSWFNHALDAHLPGIAYEWSIDHLRSLELTVEEEGVRMDVAKLKKASSLNGKVSLILDYHELNSDIVVTVCASTYQSSGSKGYSFYTVPLRGFASNKAVKVASDEEVVIEEIAGFTEAVCVMELQEADIHITAVVCKDLPLLRGIREELLNRLDSRYSDEGKPRLHIEVDCFSKGLQTLFQKLTAHDDGDLSFWTDLCQSLRGYLTACDKGHLMDPAGCDTSLVQAKLIMQLVRSWTDIQDAFAANTKEDCWEKLDAEARQAHTSLLEVLHSGTKRCEATALASVLSSLIDLRNKVDENDLSIFEAVIEINKAVNEIGGTRNMNQETKTTISNRLSYAAADLLWISRFDPRSFQTDPKWQRESLNIFSKEAKDCSLEAIRNLKQTGKDAVQFFFREGDYANIDVEVLRSMDPDEFCLLHRDVSTLATFMSILCTVPASTSAAAALFDKIPRSMPDTNGFLRRGVVRWQLDSRKFN